MRAHETMATIHDEVPDIEVASFGRRLAGLLLDLVVTLGIAIAPVLVLFTVGVLFLPLTVPAYYIFANAYGGTLGKRILSMRLVNAETGENIGVLRSIGRLLVSVISLCFLFVGYLWAGWDDKNQTWHDKAAGSLVVKETFRSAQSGKYAT